MLDESSGRFGGVLPICAIYAMPRREYSWKYSVARALTEEMMEQIDAVEALQRGVHLFATIGMPARDLAPRTGLRQGRCCVRLSHG